MGEEKVFKKILCEKNFKFNGNYTPTDPKIGRSPDMNKTTPRHSTVTLTGKGQPAPQQEWLQRMEVMLTARGLDR